MRRGVEELSIFISARFQIAPAKVNSDPREQLMLISTGSSGMNMGPAEGAAREMPTWTFSISMNVGREKKTKEKEKLTPKVIEKKIEKDKECHPNKSDRVEKVH